MPPQTRSLLTLALVGALSVACSATPTRRDEASPSGSLDPSAGPIVETDPVFCDALVGLEEELAALRFIRLRPQNRRALDDQWDEIDIAVDELRRIAPEGLEGIMEALRRANIELGLGVDDYTTTDRLEEAADHMARRELAMDRLVGRIRLRTTCPPPPTREPRTPMPDLTEAPGPGGPTGPIAGSPVP